MDRLVRLVSGASVTRGSDYDDFADRLSSRYTVVILVAFAVLVGMNQYVRNPITCWTPNHFSGAHSRYTVRYCWVRNTYYLPWSTQFPPHAAGHCRKTFCDVVTLKVLNDLIKNTLVQNTLVQMY